MPEEAIIALRQNLAQPGKIIVVTADEGSPFPYAGVKSLLVIADSANNRYVVCDGDRHRFIEQIGSGRIGY